MLKQILGVMFILALALSFSLVTFAQDAAKQEMKKDEKKMEMEKKTEMTKDEKAMGPLKSLYCDETCGFMVRSRDETEVMSAMKSHVKRAHKMAMTNK